MNCKIETVARDAEGDLATVTLEWQDDNSITETYTSEAGSVTKTVKGPCDCCGDDLNAKMTMLFAFAGRKLTSMAATLLGAGGSHEDRERAARQAIRDARRPPRQHRHHNRRPN